MQVLTTDVLTSMRLSLCCWSSRSWTISASDVLLGSSDLRDCLGVKLPAMRIRGLGLVALRKCQRCVQHNKEKVSYTCED